MLPVHFWVSFNWKSPSCYSSPLSSPPQRAWDGGVLKRVSCPCCQRHCHRESSAFFPFCSLCRLHHLFVSSCDVVHTVSWYYVCTIATRRIRRPYHHWLHRCIVASPTLTIFGIIFFASPVQHFQHLHPSSTPNIEINHLMPPTSSHHGDVYCNVSHYPTLRSTSQSASLAYHGAGTYPHHSN